MYPSDPDYNELGRSSRSSIAVAVLLKQYQFDGNSLAVIVLVAAAVMVFLLFLVCEKISRLRRARV